MRIAGLQKLTLLDFPGKTAATVFTPGCNFRCPFCHNADLVTGEAGRDGAAADSSALSIDELFAFLGKRQGLLDGVPKSFPALKQAQKISRKAASAGFEWETVDDVWAKVDEEVAELKAAYAAAPKSANGKVDAAADPAAVAAVELEMGDVLFSLVNVARKMGVQAEEALRATCGKFRARWAFMEGAAAGQGRRVEDLSMEEMEELWQLSKVLEGDGLG